MKKRRSTIESMPKKKTKTQGEKEPGYSTEIDTPDVFLTPKTLEEIIPNSDVDIEEFHTPKSVEEEEEPFDVASMIKETKEKESTEGERFFRIFYDYPGFINFIESEVCNTGSDCFCELMTSISPAKHSTSEFISSFFSKKRFNARDFDYSIFTTRSPDGYSIYSEVNPHVLGGTTPFFDAMINLFKRIPRLDPSRETTGNKISLYRYMILIDRLIYFYHIYILHTQRKLNGFSNTAGFLITYHGAYRSFEETDKSLIRKVKPPVENLFICTKAAPSCVAYSYPNEIIREALNEKYYLQSMTNEIKQKGYVNFDRVAFPDYKCSKKKQDKCVANCYLEGTRRGNSMEHYISPKTDEYIDKIYYSGIGELRYIIDLEKFDIARKSDVLDTQELLKSCCITETSFIKDRMVANKAGYMIKGYYISLRDIIHYASHLGKQNVFIYDRSCGTIDPMTKQEKVIDPITRTETIKTILPPIEDVMPLMERFARLGFGISKRRRHKQRGRTKNRKDKQHKRNKSRKIKK